MQKYLLALGALCLVGCANPTTQVSHTTPVVAHKQACPAVSDAQIAGLFDRWNASLQTKDPKQVVSNYAKDGLLLATVSNKPRTNPDEIADYFVHFMEKSPKGTIVKRTITKDCNTAVDAGLYNFTFEDGQVVKGRYTFVYKFDGKNWLISHHHSSAMPEVVASH